MATIKSFTSLEQAKKLAEILPLESADMRYQAHYDSKSNLKYVPKFISTIIPLRVDIPCWSLAALLKLLPKSAQLEKGNVTELYRITLPIELVPFDWFVEPVDACVAMIEKLHELNLL